MLSQTVRLHIMQCSSHGEVVVCGMFKGPTHTMWELSGHVWAPPPIRQACGGVTGIGVAWLWHGCGGVGGMSLVQGWWHAPQLGLAGIRLFFYNTRLCRHSLTGIPTVCGNARKLA